MAHAHEAPDTISRVSVDPAEMASFSRMAADWWDPKGPFKPLHIMNGARLGFIKETLCEHFHRDPNAELPLKGLRILDIGCGGGLLCEPLTRLGAQMTGVDAMKAFAFAIVGAEYVLRWLPKGTHQYNKFVKPAEIQRWLTDAGLTPQPSVGMSLNPVTSVWKFSNDLSINYVTVATKS